LFKSFISVAKFHFIAILLFCQFLPFFYFLHLSIFSHPFLGGVVCVKRKSYKNIRPPSSHPIKIKVQKCDQQSIKMFANYICPNPFVVEQNGHNCSIFFNLSSFDISVSVFFRILWTTVVLNYHFASSSNLFF
jgi:hypothetical protein